MNPLRALKTILSLTCEDATRLASDGVDRRLTRVERVAAGLHGLICAGCRRFHRQVRAIHRAMGRLPEAPPPGEGLSESARQRIKEAIRNG